MRLNTSARQEPARRSASGPAGRGEVKGSRQAVVVLRAAVIALALLSASCNNSPYPAKDANANVVYNPLTQLIDHLDPALTYGGASAILCNIVETPFQYNYIDRPYKLDPLLATEVPRPEQRTIEYDGNTIEATVYTIHLLEGVKYENHPCFVAENRRLTEKDYSGIRNVRDFEKTATREMVASDFVYGVRRTADPRLEFPGFTAFAPNLLGYADYNKELKKRLNAKRGERREGAGLLFNQEMDEQYNPIKFDHTEASKGFPFIREIDKYTFEIVLKKSYPQILYWMTFNFFAPVPPEAIEFFNQRGMLERDMTFDLNPVGTGPYLLENYDPTNEIALVRNKNFRGELYPSLPEPGPDAAPETIENYKLMKEHGMLEDSGKPMPFIDRVLWRMEKEAIPRWNKFLQGYYDTSIIQPESFDQTISLTSRGSLSLTDEMRKTGIELLKCESPSIRHYAFNMEDPVFGGLTEKKRKLRQAISIAINSKEALDIFNNGVGAEAQHLIPPGIFGFEPGENGINPYVFNWDPIQKKPVRKPIEDAKRLLAEAGYPNGVGSDGQRLEIYYPTLTVSADRRNAMKLLRKQLDRIGVDIKIEEFASSVFWDKIRNFDFQMSRFGWAADYPDPETFLILYYLPKEYSAGSERQNQSGYNNPRYNELFEKMSQMESGPERKAIISEMLQIVTKDAPGVFATHSMGMALKHAWLKNYYIYPLCKNTTKYIRLDAANRAEYQKKNNPPIYWPVFVLAGVLLASVIPAALATRRHLRER